MSTKNFIEGVIRLTSPMHCAMPGDKLNDAVQTMKIRLITGADRSDTLPYFPGNDLRGRLRRKAAAIVMPALVNGKKLPLELYAGLTCGAADASPENELSVEEALRSAKHVYMGLFGGGKRMLRSRFSVQDLVPITQTTLVTSLVPRHFEHPDAERDEQVVDSAFKLIDHRHMIRVDDVMRVSRPEEVEAMIDEAATAVPAYQAYHLGTAATRKAEKKDGVSDETRTKKSDVANMMKVEVIAPGTPMYFRVDFHDTVSDAQVGLLVQSMQALFAEQALGGWTRIGFGKYSIVNMHLSRNGLKQAVFKDGDDSFALHESMSTYTTAAQEQVAALSRDEMLSYFIPSKPESGE